MSNLIYQLGKKRLENGNLYHRLIFNLGNYDHDDTDSIVMITIKYIQEKHQLNLFGFRAEKIERENKIGFSMKWHIDDCSIYKHKTTDGKIHNEILNEKYSLHHLKLLPKFTMMIYLTGGNDFEGGEFEFVDKTIKPEKYDVILFDSREVHRVKELKSGVRKNILVKFFEHEK